MWKLIARMKSEIMAVLTTHHNSSIDEPCSADLERNIMYSTNIKY